MSNVLVFNDIVTRASLDNLENYTVALKAVNRSYDNQFAQTGAKIGDTLRVRLPERVITTRGAALQVRDIAQQTVPVSITEQYQCAINFASAEQALKMDDFEERYLKPRMIQLANDIDVDILGQYWRIPNVVGTPGTTPAGTTVLIQALQRLREEGYGNSPDVTLLLNFAANTSLIPALQGLFNPVDKITRQFNSGIVAENILGYKQISVTASLPNHTTGDWGTSITVGSTVTTEGSSQISLSFTGSSKTWNRGDVFTIAGVNAVNPMTRFSTGQPRQFTVTEVATGSSSVTLSVFPAMYSSTQPYASVTALPQSGAVVTMVGSANSTYQQSLALHKDALYFVTADLPMPGSGVEASSRQVYKGVSMRMIKAYDINNDNHPLRFDVLAGFGGLRPLGGVRIIGAQI